MDTALVGRCFGHMRRDWTRGLLTLVLTWALFSVPEGMGRDGLGSAPQNRQPPYGPPAKQHVGENQNSPGQFSVAKAEKKSRSEVRKSVGASKRFTPPKKVVQGKKQGAVSKKAKKTAKKTKMTGRRSSKSSKFLKTYKDKAAGLQFKNPFGKGSSKKTGKQVQALIRENYKGTEMKGVSWTGGLYSKKSLPFVLVWTHKRPGVPTQASLLGWASKDGRHMAQRLGLRRLSFDRKRLQYRGTLGSSLTGKRNLKGKVLVQMMKNQISYVGFYYKSKNDLRFWRTLSSSLKVVKNRRLAWERLPEGGGVSWSLVVLGAILGGFLGGAIAIAIRLRQQQAVPDAPGPLSGNSDFPDAFVDLKESV